MKGPLFVFFSLVSVALAEECDLRVVIRGYDNKPADARVAIIDMTGKLLAETNSKGGVAEFCDVGLATVNVVVGGDHCGQVYVRGIKLVPISGVLRTVPVYFRNCHGFIAHTACDVLIRLVDEQGRKLAGATVTIGRYIYKSDRFGRVSFGLSYDKPAELIARYADLGEQRLTVLCGPNREDVERTIVLKHVGH